MHTPDAKRPWRRGLVIGLALLSLIVSVAAVFFRNEPAVPFTDPARMSYYRQTILALALGIVCAVGAFIGARVLTTAWLGWLSIVLASLGVLIGAYLLLGLIGTCGPRVLWGVCTP